MDWIAEIYRFFEYMDKQVRLVACRLRGVRRLGGIESKRPEKDRERIVFIHGVE